ncbi:MAG: SCO family protein [Candidatus Eremiobacteraeota bacterium]|nr:SCO family protein [Candidatus Eremiobacteraeota bacterium]MCW5869875.1 SCO family protein [Candidatus Eremiobacteraeota bacterium]
MRKRLHLIILGSCLGLAAALPLPDSSLYQLSSSWVNQRGSTLQLSQLRGQIQVLALIYTHCQGICPAIVKEMKALEAELSPAQRQRVGFVLVTMDPQTDSVARLQEYARAEKLGAGWSLLRGAPEDVRELAATLDFRYRKSGAKDYAHSAMLTVLDEQGEVAEQQLGLSGRETISRKLQQLLAQP